MVARHALCEGSEGPVVLHHCPLCASASVPPSLPKCIHRERELPHGVQTSVHIGLFNSATESYLNQTLVV